MKSQVSRLLAKAGFQLSRIQTDPPKGYYRASLTCQIPNLTTIYENVLGSRDNGFFVEVGAFDGESYSNTSCLADRGWTGILIEPVPKFADQAAQRHSNNPAVKIVRKAAGRAPGEIEMTVAGSLSTANIEMVEEYAVVDWARGYVEAHGAGTIKVPVATLDMLLEEEGAPEGFDLISIDTEGFESEVLAGFTISRWRPKLILIELVDFHPDITSRRQEDRRIAREIVAEGYEIIFKDAINTVFARVD